MQVLILGCGDIGTRVGLSLLESRWRVAAVRRKPELLPERFNRYGVDLTDPHHLSELAALEPDYVVVTPTPQSYDPKGYEAGFTRVAEGLASQQWLSRCRRVVWVSSTRVYSESAGGWVDEHSPLNINEPQAAAIVAAEATIRRAVTTTIIRPAGVYGDPNGMLMRRVRAAEGGSVDMLYGNRIHRDDLSRLVVHCLRRDDAGESVPPTLIAADDDHTPTHEVEDWLAAQLNVTLVRHPAASRARANRRCYSGLLKQIGFSLSYPTWREGYGAALEQRSVD